MSNSRNLYKCLIHLINDVFLYFFFWYMQIIFNLNLPRGILPRCSIYTRLGIYLLVRVWVNRNVFANYCRTIYELVFILHSDFEKLPFLHEDNICTFKSQFVVHENACGAHHSIKELSLQSRLQIYTEQLVRRIYS